jgi:transposase-like protein
LIDRGSEELRPRAGDGTRRLPSQASGGIEPTPVLIANAVVACEPMESPPRLPHLRTMNAPSPTGRADSARYSEVRGGQPALDLVLREIRAIRFEGRRPSCVHCGAPGCGKWGSFTGRQRYRCRACKRTFSDLTGTRLAHTKRLVRWPLALRLMEEAATLRRTARCSGIHVSTALRWRHLVLRHRVDHPRPSFDSTVAYQVQSLLSRRKFQDSEWSRGETIAPVQPRFLIVVGRQSSRKRPELRYRWMGAEGPQPGARRLEELLGPWISNRCLLLVRGRHSSGAKMARKLGVAWRREGDRAFRVGLDARLARWGGAVFRRWMRRFRGVSYRFLPNYLEWHLMVRENLEGRVDPGTRFRRLPVGESGLRLIRELVR